MVANRLYSKRPVVLTSPSVCRLSGNNRLFLHLLHDLWVAFLVFFQFSLESFLLLLFDAQLLQQLISLLLHEEHELKTTHDAFSNVQCIKQEIQRRHYLRQPFHYHTSTSLHRLPVQLNMSGKGKCK
jgi:hypothetical protein